MLAQNQYVYMRERRRFGRQCSFSDRTQLMFSIYPSQRLRYNYVLLNPITRSTQLSCQFALTEIETVNVVHTEHGMLHYEGGWPREININDEEQTLRYRKKIEREDSWGYEVVGLIKASINVCLQNTAVNIYEEFFEEFPSLILSGVFEANQCMVFRDPVHPCRPIVCVDFSAMEINNLLTVHRANANFELITTEDDPQESRSPHAIFAWDVDSPLKPCAIYDSTDFLYTARFCPKDEMYVAGGSKNGIVTVWDARNGGEPSQESPLESTHRESAQALCWVHSKSNTEFYTGSFDGSIKFWDGRDLFTPQQEILLDPLTSDEQDRARSHGVAVLEFEYTIPVRFIVASDHGHIFTGNRKGTSPSEILINNFKIFAGIIRTVERNPFFVKNFLITGDWMAKIWAEETKSCPTTLVFKKKCQVLCGSWSTSRCSLFVTGDMDGNLDFWDLLLNHRQPIFIIKYETSVTHVKFRSDGRFLAIGLRSGETHILEMDPAMKHTSSKERSLIAALFEREQLRSKLLEGRVEELKLRRKTSMLKLELLEAEAEKKAEDEIPAEVLDINNPKDLLKIIEADGLLKEVMGNFHDIVARILLKRRDREFIMQRTDFEKALRAINP